MLRQRHVVRLETRPANIEGKGAVRARELVVNALRMRPDRIIVGEVRSEEALDMLQAMNTGHDGSLTTVHANSQRDALYRLDTMVAMANLNIPERAIRQQIASAVNLIVQVSRMSDGTRKVTGITEITGMEGDVITMQDIFVFETHRHRSRRARCMGRFRATGIRPKCSDRIAAAGMPLPHGHVRSRQGRGLRKQLWLIVVATFVVHSRHRPRRVLGVRRSASISRRRRRCASGCSPSRRRLRPSGFEILKPIEQLSSVSTAERRCSRQMGRVSAPLQRDITQAGLKFTVVDAAAVVGLPGARRIYLVVSYFTLDSAARPSAAGFVAACGAVHLREADEEPGACRNSKSSSRKRSI